MNEKTISPQDALMAALSAVERVVAVLSVAPPVLTLNRFESEYIVDLFFRFGPDGVAAFAAAFGVEVAERDTVNGAPYAEARVSAHGHEVRAWWVGEIPEPLSLPSAWSAAVSA